MNEKKSKQTNVEKEETSNKDEVKVISKEDKSNMIDLDWIFDKGWLRTKK
jgi:hypothetical protein